jgi:uncharacterized membrane protein
MSGPEVLEHWLMLASKTSVLLLNAIALIFVVYATAALVAGIMRLLVFERAGRAGATSEATRGLWLDYARWLVAALTVQLGADIIESAIAPSWEAIAQLGAIAVIRTFLNYFLERDMAEARELQQTREVSDLPER